jgi:hypothetical protein
MPKSDVAKTSSGGPLKTVVNPLEMAVKGCEGWRGRCKDNYGKVHGCNDGAQAANELVIQMKIRQLKSPAAPVRARTKTRKMKLRTTR